MDQLIRYYYYLRVLGLTKYDNRDYHCVRPDIQVKHSVGMYPAIYSVRRIDDTGNST